MPFLKHSCSKLLIHITANVIKMLHARGEWAEWQYQQVIRFCGCDLKTGHCVLIFEKRMECFEKWFIYVLLQVKAKTAGNPAGTDSVLYDAFSSHYSLKGWLLPRWDPSCHSSSCEQRRGGWICGDSSDSAAVVHSVLIQISCYWRTVASIHGLAIITTEHTVAACNTFTPIKNQHVAVIIVKRQPWAQLQS